MTTEPLSRPRSTPSCGCLQLQWNAVQSRSIVASFGCLVERTLSLVVLSDLGRDIGEILNPLLMVPASARVSGGVGA